MALTPQEEALVRQLIDQQAAILSLAGNESTITSKLGATKVNLSDLSSASSVSNADLFLTRQGTLDKSSTASVLASYMAAALELSSLAPKASPIFTGNPTAPTAAQFDATNKIATMEAVQRALGNLSARYGVTVNTTLPASMAGGAVNINAPLGTVVTLPTASSVPSGGTLWFENDGNDVTIQRQVDDLISVGGENATSITLKAGETLFVESNTIGAWRVLSGSWQIRKYMPAVLATNGYQKLPGGLIIQWGVSSTMTGSPNATTTVIFPQPFPNSCASVVASSEGAGVSVSVGITTSQVLLTNSTAATSRARWFAAGY